MLAAHSDVFKSMFSHCDMTEGQTGILRIDDMQPLTVSQMLDFIYTGKTTIVKENALGLFVAGDKYNLQPLKIECEKELILGMNVQNAADNLVTAHHHNSLLMKNCACEYINTNISEVCQTLGWKNLVENYPALVKEIFRNDEGIEQSRKETKRFRFK
mmetsp:Transcript_6898/g.8610  ORF Transcript_6898/g.8610 Transcript_6898/m.8610 type:complete len:158 (-) Transcript_6898:75-548(-)